jgi:metallo-beta-lactamase family protein
VFRLHPEAFDDETLHYMTHVDPDGDIFGFSRLRYVRQVERSKEINELHEPCVIMSASGMAEAGRILHHLKNNITDSRNTVLIVGWQAPDTLGRRLVERLPAVKIFGEEYKLRAQVEVLNGFSGHGDHDDLLAWVAAQKEHPKHLFLVHGEVEAANALAADLRSKAGCPDVTIPKLHQSVDV